MNDPVDVVIVSDLHLGMLGEVRLAVMLRRLVAVAARPSRGRGTRFLHAGVRRLHGVLSAHGLAVPAYAFGHTHVAERWRLSASRDGWYVNSGTWSGVGAQRTFAEVRVEPDGHVSSHLFAWDGRDATPMTG